MAGESPDKSDKKSGKEQSSGETARTERDPRLAVLREERGERDGAGESGKNSGKDSGKSSAKSSGKGSEKASEESSAEDAGKGSEKGAEGASKEASGERASGEADGAKVAKEPVKAPEAAQEAAKGSAEGQGQAKDGEGRLRADAPADAKAGAADGAVDGAKAAVKESGKGSEGGSGKGSAEGSPAAGASDADAASDVDTASDDKAVDQATAVFKTVTPKKADAKKAEAEKSGAKTAKAGDAKGAAKDDAEKGAGAEEAPADDATRVFAVAKVKKPAESGEGSAEGLVDQATAVFKLGKDAGQDAGKGAAAKDADAKAKDVPKGKDAAKDAAKGVADADERDAERTSQFVALKSADDGSAGRSIGKTAPKAPLGKPGGTPGADPKDQKKDPKDQDQKKGPAQDGGAADGAAKGEAPGSAPAKAPEKAAGKAPEKAAEKAGEKAAEKAAGKAPGAMPAAAPAASDRKPDAGASDAPGTSAAEVESERTRQQPLPPLDLLAKLTNTPPPPETTLRTVVRRFKIWTPLAVLLVVVFAVVQAVRPLPGPTLTVGDAKSSYTFEGGTLSIPWPDKGQAAVKVVGSGSVGTFGEEKPVPTASVAKIMTAYVILRDHPLKDKNDKGPQIKVDAKAVEQGNSEHESRIEGLTAGMEFSEQDMLKMLMIPSGNNIARLLARWDSNSDSEAAFVKKMNDAAKELGMKNTTYTDPSGLDSKTVSTAVDQLKLAEAVMKFDAFRPIVAMPNADIPGLPKRINNNNDRLILAGLSVKGIKTGSSSAAGGTLSWAAYKTVDGKDRLILGTMMDQHFTGLDPDGSNSLRMVQDNSQKVIQAVRNALTSATAVKKGQVVGYVDDGLGGQTPVVATKDLTAIGVPGQKLGLQVDAGGKTVPHEAKAGTVVGELIVGTGAEAQRVPVALQKDLVEPTFGAKLTRLG
ncbi:D-alanyl-D-alanine carboxypeptidase [Streptomyces sp. 769]|uniref:D-alanyl-D-alanine carboxypeptidase family protein n=1 Tax=Streptomyces sp. 769 TaxID=1262452 RepID=UPI00057F1086|nr:D-alanyl-D-alanine carboxypeptidase [Streptomyces sp. 769]